MEEKFSTPILLVVFNRPEVTQRVFDRIRELKPKDLYISADGPRAHVERDQTSCAATRAIFDQVDWDCNVHKLFREKNMGCGPAVSSGITWFFEQVEEGIILEDDCLPSKSFFQFCSTLLQKYRDDNRVWHIAGYNSQNGNVRGSGDYFFSQETSIWGWASWRRVWLEHYHLNIDLLPVLEKSGSRTGIKNSYLQSITSLFDFRKVYDGKINTWDYQYSFYQVINSGLSIIPNRNLVQNIGFNSEATHTTSSNTSLVENLATEQDYSDMKHPIFVLPDIEADAYTYNKRTRLLKKIYVRGWFLYRTWFKKD